MNAALMSDVDLKIIASVAGRTAMISVMTKSDELTHVIFAATDVDSTYRVAIRLGKEEARKFARDILKGLSK